MVYSAAGKRMAEFEAGSVEDALDKLEDYPRVVSYPDTLNIRIEDANHAGCWIIAGPPEC
jgi:hypothetical protein